MRKDRDIGVGNNAEGLRIDPSERMVIVVFGRPGVGKTAVANEIARRLGIFPYNSDEYRRKKFSDRQYQEWHSTFALQSMIKDAKEKLIVGFPTVVFDATLSKRMSREALKRFASAYHRKIVWVEVRSDISRVGANIDGDLVIRRVEEPNEIKQRIVVNNTAVAKDKEEHIRKLVDRIFKG